MKRRGLSLLEVVIALALVALGVVFVLGIIPTGVLSVKRSEDMEAATSYGMEVIENARHKLPPEAETDTYVTFNKTDFHVQRAIYSVDDYTTDIVVVVRWSEESPGIRLATRVRGKPSASPSP